MANDVDTSYTLEGVIPKELQDKFNQIKANDMEAAEIIELLGLSCEPDRWYISDEPEVDDHRICFSTWSAWYPKWDPWVELAKKYDLKLSYISNNEYPVYFSVGGDFEDYVMVFYDYDEPFMENITSGQWEWLGSYEAAIEFVQDLEIETWTIVYPTEPFEWYNDELLVEEYMVNNHDDLTT